MDELLKTKILSILRKHRLMTVATSRADGWPQATTVGYVHDGLTIYFLCDTGSQKAINLARDDRVSLTINRDTPNPMAVEGLSMAAHAELVHDHREIQMVFNKISGQYPEYAGLARPELDAICIFRLRPVIVSVIDYSKGFGHTDLVHVPPEGHEAAAPPAA